MTLADATVKSMAKWERKPADFYATPAEATDAIIPFLGLQEGAYVGEPACGDGDMAQVLRRAGFAVFATDLRYTGYGEGGYDFLVDLEDEFSGSMGWMHEYGLLDAIVTNPPFSLATEFIIKATSQAPVVAMLLKSNFWHTKRGRKLWLTHPPTAIYPVTWRIAFVPERGKSPLMDCTWFVWRQGDPPVPWVPLARPSVEPVKKPVSVLLRQNAEARERLGRLIGV